MRLYRTARRLGAAAVFALAPAIATPAAAPKHPPLVLQLPLDCRPGQTCWIANHVDMAPGPAARDHACGPRTYDGHKGTDIAIRDRRVMRDGVAVRAAAPGTVKDVRDGMADVDSRIRPEARIEGRECGNGVVVSHRGGWTTQYCHLRRGSVAVRKGEIVAAGQKIGLVGLSGRTMFPHLHFAVRDGKAVIDPFTGRRMQEGCAGPATPLWTVDTARALPYRPVAIVNAGMARATPDADAIRRGERPEIRTAGRKAPLILWVDILGVQKGDTVAFSIVNPDGMTIFRHAANIAKQQARRFAYAGRKAPKRGWPPGRYRGAVKVSRQGESRSLQIDATAEIEIK